MPLKCVIRGIPLKLQCTADSNKVCKELVMNFALNLLFNVSQTHQVCRNLAIPGVPKRGQHSVLISIYIAYPASASNFYLTPCYLHLQFQREQLNYCLRDACCNLFI